VHVLFGASYFNEVATWQIRLSGAENETITPPDFPGPVRSSAARSV